MIPNAIAVANGKGGVGKTSIAANLAGRAAMLGHRTLTVDLDPQGNLGADLGYRNHAEADQGASLLERIQSGGEVRVIADVRPGLDAVPGGHHTRTVADLLTVRRHVTPDAPDPLADMIYDVTSGYDLVVIDCPPTGGSIVDTVLDSVGHVLIPIRADEGSLDGLEMIARSFGRARSGPNPHLRLAGIVLFDSTPTAHAIRSELRGIVERELGGIAPVFDTYIRRSERSAFDMRRFGMLAHEYADRADAAFASTSVRARIVASKKGEAAVRFSRAARSLAHDYEQLTDEILSAMTPVHA